MDYADLINNYALMQALPELPSILKNKSEMFLSAMGVAFTKVSISCAHDFY